MRFPPQFLDELRARLPASEVVGRRVKLRKAGREWKGLSPFNKEKTPSFFVNDQKAMWFDFSSGKNGNIFDFVMQTEGVSFPEAVERLAAQAGVPLPVMTREAQAHEERRRTLHDIVELAAKFFEANLASRAGARGRGYLADRGITPATQLTFRLGYASAEQYALKEHLGAAKIPADDMVEAGLLVAGEDIAVPYDRFRDRVIFPISDWRGRVIAFGGRALDKDVPAKYLNSPETPLFHKGATLYNIAAARAAVHKAGKPGSDGLSGDLLGRVIAVEGYVDVIAMVTAGFAATVAPLGTALTADQLALMWRMADEPILCFDGDAAGRRAAYRALDLALPLIKPGKSLKFAALPDGQDPDDLVRSGGREAVEDVLNAASALADMLWRRESEAGSLQTPERRAALEARLSEVTGTIGDETVRRYYREDFAARLRRLFAPADIGPRRASWGDKLRRPGTAGSGRTRRSAFGDQGYMAASPQLAASPLHRGHRAAIPRREALILQAALNHPWLLHDRMEELAEAEFRHADTKKLKSALIDVVAHRFGQDGGADPRPETDVDRAELKAELARLGFADNLGRIGRSITTPSVWGARPEAAPSDVLLTWKQLLALHRQWHSLTRELKDAELALGQDNSEANYSRLIDVKSRLSTLDGTEALIEGFGDQSGRPTRSF
jgi:DNA primase